MRKPQTPSLDRLAKQLIQAASVPVGVVGKSDSPEPKPEAPAEPAGGRRIEVSGNRHYRRSILGALKRAKRQAARAGIRKVEREAPTASWPLGRKARTNG